MSQGLSERIKELRSEIDTSDTDAYFINSNSNHVDLFEPNDAVHNTEMNVKVGLRLRFTPTSLSSFLLSGAIMDEDELPIYQVLV